MYGLPLSMGMATRFRQLLAGKHVTLNISADASKAALTNAILWILKFIREGELQCFSGRIVIRVWPVDE
jgi:hypothetical protein